MRAPSAAFDRCANQLRRVAEAGVGSTVNKPQLCDHRRRTYKLANIHDCSIICDVSDGDDRNINFELEWWLLKVSWGDFGKIDTTDPLRWRFHFRNA